MLGLTASSPMEYGQLTIFLLFLNAGFGDDAFSFAAVHNHPKRLIETQVKREFVGGEGFLCIEPIPTDETLFFKLIDREVADQKGGQVLEEMRSL